ncbi:ATP-grasp domain-containing protein [Mameliella alba]|nr:ATP-grasp domain-containing protein [Mameliella alba]MBY6169540.1 ATP-grasp domain-containing protein [Mameliella alba]MBY6174559.1 ATP-grasp domain-containing protein [Mameliella alba]
MTVHILAPDDTLFGINRHVARVGFSQLGEEVCLFDTDGFDALDLRPGDRVVGGIGFAQRGMRRLGIAVPDLDSVPAELMPFAGRRIWQATMAEARRMAGSGCAVFVKPRPERLKLFTGTLLRNFADLIPTAHIPDDEPVICADPVDFVTEYRGFVLHGDLIDLRPYRGDPLAFPDPEVIRNALAVQARAAAPSAYALDFGVTSDGRTLVVEINDGYAVGAYGLSPLRYARLIETRWAELEAASA